MAKFVGLTDYLGRIVRPILGKYGANDYRELAVNADGQVLTAKGGSPITSKATGSGAIAKTVIPGAAFRLLRVELHLDSAPASTAEDFTVNIDAGDGATYDIKLIDLDLYTNGVQDLVKTYGEGFEYGADDEVDIAWANTPTETYGVKVVYELI